jgi:rSAM/selenodomain-associated transferase 2
MHKRETLKISVIIPTLDEEDLIAGTIASGYRAGVSEIIVADGGSRDSTKATAEALGAQVVEAARGRARQMNEGAGHATGEVLLFLHADTLLPPSCAPLVSKTLSMDGVVAGAFAYTACGAGLWDPILTVGGRARCRVSGHPYGDQGLFLLARTFHSLGGFPDIPVMEDWEIVYRLRQAGRVVVLDTPAVTSAASFAEQGMLRASFWNLVAIVGYQLGVRPHRLASLRDRIARRRSGRESRRRR